jgi:peptide deformylase
MHPDPRLRQVCAPVETVSAGDRAGLVALAREMLDVMYAAPGRGLAAPQIGVLTRVFVMDATWKEGLPAPRVFVNPEIVGSDGQQVNAEACLSIADVSRRVARPARVRLAFDGPSGRIEEEFAGFAAACVCHEMDHLDGRLILDHPEVP